MHSDIILERNCDFIEVLSQGICLWANLKDTNNTTSFSSLLNNGLSELFELVKANMRASSYQNTFIYAKEVFKKNTTLFSRFSRIFQIRLISH